jgi:hypothetical protein
VAAGAAILPVALHGTGACLDADGPRRAHATAEVLAPIETAGLAPGDLPALRDGTRAVLAAALSRGEAGRDQRPRAGRDRRGRQRPGDLPHAAW